MPDEAPKDTGLGEAARYAGFGFEFAATIVAGVLLGNYLDQRFGTSPWLILLFTLGAMIGAVQRLISSLKKHSSR